MINITKSQVLNPLDPKRNCKIVRGIAGPFLDLERRDSNPMTLHLPPPPQGDLGGLYLFYECCQHTPVHTVNFLMQQLELVEHAVRRHQALTCHVVIVLP